MPEQEQGQPDGSEFHIDGGSNDQNTEVQMAEASEKSHSEDESLLYDEQKATTIGAAVLEHDRLDAERGGGTDKYKAELADIDEDMSRVRDGGRPGMALKDRSGKLVSIPADAQAIRRNLGYDDRQESRTEYGRLRDTERMNAYDIEKSEAALTQEQVAYADRLERKRQEYDEYVAEREIDREDAIARGRYDPAEAEKHYRIPTFAEYIHNKSPFGNKLAEWEVYPELDTRTYRHIGELEGQKARHAEYKKELSEIELAELKKMREVRRETLQKYLNQKSDYYAELYDLNPDLFATMPTKEFMEHRDELARIEQPIGSWEYMKDQYADVVDTIQRVLANVEARNGTLVTIDEDGNVESRIDHWFEPDYLQKVFVGTVVGKTFFLRDADEWNYPQEKAKTFLEWAHTDVKSDSKTGLLEWEGRADETDFPYYAAEMKTFIHTVDGFFADYNRHILDTAPRQLFEGFANIMEKLKTGVEGQIHQARAEADALKQRFAPDQQNNTTSDSNVENQ